MFKKIKAHLREETFSFLEHSKFLKSVEKNRKNIDFCERNSGEKNENPDFFQKIYMHLEVANID